MAILVLGSAAPAFADAGGTGANKSGGSDTAAEHRSDNANPGGPTAQDHRSDASGTSAQKANGGGFVSNVRSAAARAAASKRKTSARRSGRTSNGVAGSATPHDPPGDNGTLKVHSPGDATMGTDPMLDDTGCLLQVDLYGFDSDQSTPLEFELVSPTRGDIVLTDPTAVTDGDGNGYDGTAHDFSKVYDLNQVLLSSGVDKGPHGWHLRVSSDNKQKMVWVDCNPTTSSLGTVTDLSVPVVPLQIAGASPALVAAGLPAAFVQANAADLVPVRPTQVLGTTFDRPGLLAKTGSNGMLQLMALGGALVLVGVVVRALTQSKGSSQT